MKEIQVEAAQPEITFAMRNPVPSGSRKRTAQAAAVSSVPSSTKGLCRPA